MTSKIEAQNSGGGLEKIKWCLVVLLVLLAIAGNYYLNLPHDYFVAPAIRISAVVAVIGVALLIALLTKAGKAGLTFAKESRIELRKVIWPTRQETLQTTMIVMAATAVVSLCLWLIDGAMVHAISFITSIGV